MEIVKIVRPMGSAYLKNIGVNKMIRKKLEEYLEVELNTVKRDFMNEDDFIQRNNLCWYAIQRGYGAFNLAMLLGLDLKVVDEMNIEYRNKLEKLLHPTLQDEYSML